MAGLDQRFGISLLHGDIAQIHFGRVLQRLQRRGFFSRRSFRSRQAQLQEAVVWSPFRGAFQSRQAGRHIGVIKMQPVKPSPERAAEQPIPTRKTRAPTLGSGQPSPSPSQTRFGESLANATPLSGVFRRNRAIRESRSFQIAPSRRKWCKFTSAVKRQKAGAKIGVKHAADNPWTRDKQRDSTGHQYQQISRITPRRISRRAGFLTLVITGDPEILRRMQHRQNAAGIARLRHFFPARQLDDRRQQEPQELRGHQRGGWQRMAFQPPRRANE